MMTDDNLPHEIPLAGASNFRDLGGYAAEPGSVRYGAVYRSGRLPGLTDSDLRTVEDLGVRTVVTLLTDDDVAEYGPDRLPAAARSVALPIDSPTRMIPGPSIRRRETGGGISPCRGGGRT